MPAEIAVSLMPLPPPETRGRESFLQVAYRAKTCETRPKSWVIGRLSRTDPVVLTRFGRSLLTQGDCWIDAQGRRYRQHFCEQCDHEQDDDDSGKSRRIGCADAVQRSLQISRCRNGADQAGAQADDNDRQPAAQDEPDDVCAGGAQCRTDADLASALAHPMRDDR